MTQRFTFKTMDAAAYTAMMALENYVKETPLDTTLKEFLKIRVSQINKCAYCIDMHAEYAMKHGVAVEKIIALPAWKESAHFTAAEKTALQFAEEVTCIAAGGVSDETYTATVNNFGLTATTQILMLIVLINSWNRIAITGKMQYKK